MSVASKRLPVFETIRTVAILLLLLHHSGFYNMNLNLPLQMFSPFIEAFLLGCFFFMAGYFTEVSLRRSEGNLMSFFVSRFIKIYPPYLAALWLYISVLGITLREKFDILVYVTGLQFVFAGMVKPIVTLWYVGAIILFYLLFALMWKLMPKTNALILGAAFVFALSLALHRGTGLLDARFFKYYFVFLSGMILARENVPGFILSKRHVFLKGSAALVGAMAFSLVVDSDPVSALYILCSYSFIVSATLLLFSISLNLPAVSSLKWVSFVSYASYFVYLFHRPFWKLLEDAFHVQGSQNQILVKLLPASLLVVLACYFFQRLYDALLAAIGRQSQKLKSTV